MTHLNKRSEPLYNDSLLDFLAPRDEQEAREEYNSILQSQIEADRDLQLEREHLGHLLNGRAR